MAYAPGRDMRLPAVDERLVAPEAHAEIVEGRGYRTMGANEPHATEHTVVAHLRRACLAKGDRVAVDMLTRATKSTDAARARIEGCDDAAQRFDEPRHRAS